MDMSKENRQSDHDKLTFLVWMVNSTSSLSRSSSFILASEKWKKISFTTSARSMNPKLSFMEQTTPWYFTGCAGFSSRIWQAPKLPLLHRQSGQPKKQWHATRFNMNYTWSNFQQLHYVRAKLNFTADWWLSES